MGHIRLIRHWEVDRLQAHTHTGACRQCTIEAGVGADGSACIHMGMGSRGFGRAKGWDRAAYTMPGWISRTASKKKNLKIRRMKDVTLKYESLEHNRTQTVNSL